MTPTAQELIDSKEFWQKRLAQQAEYIRYLNKTWKDKTRPDKWDVLNSAIAIANKCHSNILRLKE
jgi:hypothetical protein